MASITGSVSPFNETEDTWQAYAERLEHLFLANEIDSEAKKRAVLLSSMGVKPYKLLSNSVAPRKAGECSYTEIVDVLKNHHNPRPSTIVQRFKFNTRVRDACESIRTFVAELKKLSKFSPLCRNLLINGTAVKFQIDTGASLSVMNKKTFVEKVNIPLKPSSKVLKTYTGENVQICGEAEVTLHGKPDTTSKFYRARQPPYALREAIVEELSRLQRDGIVEPVDHSDWATLIVPVRKQDGTVRMCGDYKITVNKVCKGDDHPILRIEDLAYALSGGDKFTKLDLSQLQLDEESRKYTTINTHKGLFTYHRLCSGISAAPGIFQRTMEGVFRHVSGCVNYLDDVSVTGKNDEDHLRNLHKVLSICEEKGLSLRRDKCEFMQQEVTFLGYRLDKNGVYPLADKIKAIRDAPTPNTQELRSFLGLVNFYGKFTPNVSQVLAPLYQLLRQGQRWC
ncbi:hypothetical protein RRG08_041454 [Elysia crispata]|uniref:Reverse transcriptase domain-containing protein n=1 Tax=Elysia crispata TaxID=231223 RepID=A0AAE1BAD5_9GAST|nr:hypothetical protein RRG08_041454 [Elysia crispata]